MRLLAAAVVCAALAGGCGSDDKVKEGEVVPALEKLGLDIHYRDIPEPAGVDEIVAGRATRNGVSLDFAILVGDAASTTDRAPVVPYMGFSSGIGFGNAFVIRNDLNAIDRDRKALKAKGRIGLEIESAVCDLVPDTPCAGA